ncbi:uncharacterized protein LOC111060804 [Nilaparvata lugens]|uniref:uncharacterized protein LOC111060804 n=1 Tax=Nilaparvata lugens TaxID=108931 RepID=UPI00193E7450|nr:uncharacterized protein LOC111060804 [Nilaparvata lugens]
MPIRVDLNDIETYVYVKVSVGSPSTGINVEELKIEPYSSTNTEDCKQIKEINKKCRGKTKKSRKKSGSISAMSAVDTSSYGPIAQKYLPKKGDFRFGIHFDKVSKSYKIGKVPMVIQKDDILVKYEDYEQLYRGTVGLWRLLSQDTSYFHEDFYFNDEDWVVYMEILMRANPADCANQGEKSTCKMGARNGGGSQDITPYSYQGGNNQGINPYSYQGGNRGVSPCSYQGGNQGVSPCSYQGGNQGVSPCSYQGRNQGVIPCSYQGGNQGVSPCSYQGRNQGIYQALIKVGIKEFHHVLIKVGIKELYHPPIKVGIKEFHHVLIKVEIKEFHHVLIKVGIKEFLHALIKVGIKKLTMFLSRWESRGFTMFLSR